MKRYVVRNNGLRCFVAPCFCWDAVSDDGETTTFSDLDFPQLSDQDRARRLRDAELGGLTVHATTVDYEDRSVPGVVAAGRRLVVHRTED